MNTLKTNPTLLKPEVLLRFLLCGDAAHPTNTRVAPDAWIDFDTAFGPQFQPGTEHKVTRLSPDGLTNRYVVAKSPYLHQIPHPGHTGKMVPMATLYLAPVKAA